MLTNYTPGSFPDRVVEAFAGPHDYFNSGYWYNATGNARNLTGAGYYFGQALNYSNVMTVTPFVAASAVPNYIYPMVVNYSDQ